MDYNGSMAASKRDKKDPALERSAFMQQLGKSGIIMVNGIVSMEEYNKDLTGKKGIETFNEIRLSDGTARAALLVCKLPLIGANWTVEAANDSDEAQRAQKICKYSLFDNNNFEQDLREVCTMFDFGFSMFEQVFEIATIEGKEYVVLKDMAFMKQMSLKSWQMDSSKEPGMTQFLQNGQTAEIPEIKLAVFTNDREGDNKNGYSLLRAAYKHWYMKDNLYKIDVTAHEKQGLGILKVKVPGEAKPEDQDKAREIAREQRANEEAFIEELEGYSFEFMDMKAKTTRDIMPSIDHHDRMILQSVLAQFLTIGSSSSSGSYSASQDQTELFIMSEEASAKNIQSVYNDKVIRNLCLLNAISEENMPKLNYGRIGKDTIQVFAEALSKLFTSGVITPDPELENYVRKFLHIPDLPKDVGDNYDAVRAVRRNPSGIAPTPSESDAAPTTGSDGLTATQAHEVITIGRKMRDALREAASAIQSSHADDSSNT